MVNLPENFFSLPEANAYFQSLNSDVERIVNAGEYYDAIIAYHIKAASPTFGLIVAGGKDNQWYYWHQDGYVAEFSDREAQEPRVFRRLSDAKKRVEKLNDPHNMIFSCPAGYKWEIAVWCHPQSTILHHKERFALMRRRFPGSPRH